MEMLAGSPQAFASFHKAEQERWFRLIRENDIKDRLKRDRGKEEKTGRFENAGIVSPGRGGRQCRCGVSVPAIVRAQNQAQGADRPKGPIKFVVPFPPGGSTDPVARIIQAKLTEHTGWNVVVENKPGGAAWSAPRSSPSRRPTATPG